MQVLLPFLVGVSVLLGYFIATKVPEELAIGKPWFLVASAVGGVTLFLLLPWWKAAIILGTVLVGWIPALLGLGWAAASATNVLTQVLVFLGVLLGTRWRVEGQKPVYLYVFTALVTVAAMATVLL